SIWWGRSTSRGVATATTSGWARTPSTAPFACAWPSPPHGRGPGVPRRVLEGPGPAGAGPVRQRPRVGRLGAVGPRPVAGDLAVPALRRESGVHARRGAAVQRQRRELQRLVPAAAARPALPAPGRPAARVVTAAGGGQHAACPPPAGRANAGATPAGPAAAEVARQLRG